MSDERKRKRKGGAMRRFPGSNRTKRLRKKRLKVFEEWWANLPNGDDVPVSDTKREDL